MHAMIGYRRLFLFSLSSAAVAACAISSNGPSSDSGQQEQATIIQPDGSDNPARLVVVAPAGAAASTQVRVDNTTGALGQELGPFSAGSHSVTVTSSLITSGTVTLPPNQTTTLHTGLVALDVQGAAPTLGLNGVDAGPRLWVLRGTQISNDTYVDPRLDGTAPAAVLPGSYFMSYGLTDGIRIDVAADESKTISGSAYDGRRVARVVAPTRSLPTDPCALKLATDTVPRYTFTLESQGGTPIFTSSALVADGASLDVGYNTLRSDATNQFGIILSGIADLGRTMALGAAGAGPAANPVGRLDVDDVAVAESDGSTKLVRGTYKAYPITIDASGKESVGTTNVICGSTGAKTHSGVDLFVGRYRVIVTYTVAEGTKSNVYDLDVD